LANGGVVDMATEHQHALKAPLLNRSGALSLYLKVWRMRCCSRRIYSA
jgi:hypothetical protein